MIRLPPSSIALSDSDVQFHLVRVEIARNLRAAGFSQEQIRKSLKDHSQPWFGRGSDGSSLESEGTPPSVADRESSHVSKGQRRVSMSSEASLPGKYDVPKSGNSALTSVTRSQLGVSRDYIRRFGSLLSNESLRNFQLLGTSQITSATYDIAGTLAEPCHPAISPCSGQTEFTTPICSESSLTLLGSN